MIIRGKNLMVFVGGKSVAYATSHSVDLSTNTTEVAHKDITGNGTETVAITTAWTMSSDSLYSYDGAGTGVTDLLTAWKSSTTLDLVFGLGGTFSSTGGWSIDSSETTLTGKAIITSLSISADASDNATFSITFQGTGDLTIA
jgi:predicted secreted protein